MKLFLVFTLVLFGAAGPALRAQAPLTNEDVPRLVKSGLSEDFILKLITSRVRIYSVIRAVWSNLRITVSASA